MTDMCKGLLFHPDPDLLTAYSIGLHDYDSISSAKEGYISGEICLLEFEAVVENLLQ